MRFCFGRLTIDDRVTLARGFPCELSVFVDTKRPQRACHVCCHREQSKSTAIEPNEYILADTQYFWGTHGAPFNVPPDLASVNCVTNLAIASLGTKVGYA